MGRLYLVSTPIGNREDISARAIRVLFTVDLVLAEDTRKTSQLLQFLKPNEKIPPLISFFEGNEDQRLLQVIKLLEQGKNVALVSNAGTPLISDPGFKLVRECLSLNLKVEAIPGPSALLTALVSSGLPPDKFLFLGFLPKKEGKKQKMLAKVLDLRTNFPLTVVAYESPFRIDKTLIILKQLLPATPVVIARELTKKFEETLRGTPGELLKILEAQAKLKGELVLMF